MSHAIRNWPRQSAKKRAFRRWRWASNGKGEFTVEPLPEAGRGAKIVVHLREGEDVPTARHAAVLQAVPGMRNTCFSYNDAHRQLIVERGTPLKRRSQTMPRREIVTDASS